jgi:hypothetical protein
MVEGADLVAAGSFRADLWFGYSNIFEQDSTEHHSLYLDLERLITAVTVRYGLHDRLEVGGRATLQTDWGGFLDGFVEGSYGQTLRDESGQALIDIPRRDLALEDVRLFAKWRAYASEDGRKTLSLRAVARIPTEDNLVGSERSDVGVMLLGRTQWKRWHLHALAGGSTVRRSPELEDVLVGRQAYFSVGVEHPFRPGLSGVIQFMGSTQLLRSFDDHDVDGAPMNLVFGLVGETSGGWRWQVGMQEDAPPRGPSLDFTVQLGLSRAM